MKNESVYYAKVGKVREGVPTLRLYLPDEVVQYLSAKPGDMMTFRFTKNGDEKAVVIRLAK